MTKKKEPIRGKKGASVLGPSNPCREAEGPSRLIPPGTDHGTLPSLRWSFCDSHNRLSEGGWSRQTTIRELPIAKELAGVNMRLTAGGVREMHWHMENEWAYVLKGKARVTLVDENLSAFQADVGEGEGWFFPTGIPHSIQGLGPEGCEFLLVFDDGHFDENSTFALTDWLSCTPKDVLAKNFGVPEKAFAKIPAEERYIFQAKVPPPLEKDKIQGLGKVPFDYSHRMIKMKPLKMPFGQVRIMDSRAFPASSISAALVEVEPGGMRELHWHPHADEWAYFIEGKAKMTAFASSHSAQTFDFQAGDVGYVPRAMPHYVENVGKTTLRFLEMFKSSYFKDVPLAQWLALTPHELVRQHLHVDESFLKKIPLQKTPIVGKR